MDRLLLHHAFQWAMAKVTASSAKLSGARQELIDAAEAHARQMELVLVTRHNCFRIPRAGRTVGERFLWGPEGAKDTLEVVVTSQDGMAPQDTYVWARVVEPSKRDG